MRNFALFSLSFSKFNFKKKTEFRDNVFKNEKKISEFSPIFEKVFFLTFSRCLRKVCSAVVIKNDGMIVFLFNFHNESLKIWQICNSNN